MTEIKANFPKRNTEITVLATDGKTDISADFLLAYAMLDLNDAERLAFEKSINALQDAKFRHKHFPLDKAEMISIIGEEYGEVCKAFNENDGENFSVELTHVIATCIRALVALAKGGD